MALVKRTQKHGAGTVGGFQVEGMERLVKNLEKLPQKIRRKPLLKALRTAGNITLKVARQLAPRGHGEPVTNKGNPRPRLYKTLALKTWPKPSDTTSKPSTVMIGSRVRSGKQTAPHAHLVHQGTDPHWISSRFGEGPLVVKRKGKEDLYTLAVWHPGSRPNPYLTNALVYTRNQVVQVMRNTLRVEIENHLYEMIDKP